MLSHSSVCQLTQAEEYDLAIRIKAGDLVARETLIVANLGLAVSIAKRYYSHGATLDDLIQEGSRGLIYAADRYDPETHNARFSTYAAYWILNMIQRAVMANFSLVRVPDYMFRSNFRSHQLNGESRTKNGSGLDKSMISWSSHCAINDNDEETSLEETIVDNHNPEDDLDIAEKFGELYAALDQLTPLERLTISYRFGLNDESDKTMSYREIARMLKMSVSRIQRTGNLALNKLRVFFRDQGLATDLKSRCGA
jgi:RNA polymerase primary sigma factor